MCIYIIHIETHSEIRLRTCVLLKRVLYPSTRVSKYSALRHDPITNLIAKSALRVKQSEGQPLDTSELIPILNSVTTCIYSSPGQGNVGVLITRSSKNNDLHAKSISTTQIEIHLKSAARSILWCELNK